MCLCSWTGEREDACTRRWKQGRVRDPAHEACAVQAAERAGETIYKGHRSYDLMLNLQLGVRHAVGALASVIQRPDLQPADFLTKV